MLLTLLPPPEIPMRSKRIAAVQARLRNTLAASEPNYQEQCDNEQEQEQSHSEQEQNHSEHEPSDGESEPKHSKHSEPVGKKTSASSTKRVFASRRRGKPPKKSRKVPFVGLRNLEGLRKACIDNRWTRVIEEDVLDVPWDIQLPIPRLTGTFVEKAALPINLTVDGKGGELDNLHYFRVGDGGVSALDIEKSGLLAVSSLPEFEFKDHWALSMEDMTCPIKIFKLHTQKQAPFIKTAQVAEISSDFGLVRGIKWSKHQCSNSLPILGVFGDGKVRIWALPKDRLGSFTLSNEDCLVVGDDDYIITSAEWCPQIPGRIATGTSTGLVLLWQITLDRIERPAGSRPIILNQAERIAGSKPATLNRVECIAGLRPTTKPVTSLAFHDSDPMLLAIGVFDSPSVLLDFRVPFQPQTLLSTLALVPLIRWSPLHDAWITADSEGGVRAMPFESLVDRQTIPAGTFTSQVLDVAVSPFHSILAIGGVSGTLHLTQIDSHRGQLYEEQILKVLKVDPDSIELSMKIGYPKLDKGPIPLPDYSHAISHITWSRSTDSPGVLLMGLGVTGVVMALPTDYRV